MEDPYRSIREELRALNSRLQEDVTRDEVRELLRQVERLVSALDEERGRTAAALQMLDRDVRAIENSRIFRLLRWLGRPLLEGKAKAARLQPVERDDAYDLWLDREITSRSPADFHTRPLFSILMAVSSPSRERLEQAVESVLKQTYPRWELCICEDAGESWIADYLAGKRLAGAAIRLVQSPERLGVARAWNSARGLAAGDYLLFLGQDDVLVPDALHFAAESVQLDPAVNLIYSDEDLLDHTGRRVRPVFKPDWSPNLLLSCMYLTRLLVVSQAAMARAGEFRPEFPGAEDYDLALRITDQPAVVRHIPRVLYHRRMRAEPDEAHAAGKAALEDTVRRRGWNASVEDGGLPGQYRLRWRLASQPLVSVVICSRNARQLDRCLRAIQSHTDYAQRQVVVVQHVVGNQNAMDRLLQRYGVKPVRYEGAFNFSRMNNLGAKAADGEILVFLNDDVDPLVATWLGDLAAQAQRPEVGIVGAKLLYPGGSLQHAGVAIGIQDGCGHPGRGMYTARHWPWMGLTRDVSAVTGACMATRKQVFEELGGFDDHFPVNYNDIDLCLRARQAGYGVVFESGAVLTHFECQTRGREKVGFTERARWLRRWFPQMAQGDPFYSPHLTHVGEDLSLNLEEPL